MEQYDAIVGSRTVRRPESADAAVLVLTAPLLLLLAALVKLSSPGPVFFIQERVGLDGKPFKLVKFRTMRIEGDPALVPKMREDLPGWTVPNDPRRTKIGTFLRRFSLDELPQFYNVLQGRMSIVGPRPRSRRIRACRCRRRRRSSPANPSSPRT